MRARALLAVLAGRPRCFTGTARIAPGALPAPRGEARQGECHVPPSYDVTALYAPQCTAPRAAPMHVHAHNPTAVSLLASIPLCIHTYNFSYLFSFSCFPFFLFFFFFVTSIRLVSQFFVSPFSLISHLSRELWDLCNDKLHACPPPPLLVKLLVFLNVMQYPSLNQRFSHLRSSQSLFFCCCFSFLIFRCAPDLIISKPGTSSNWFINWRFVRKTTPRFVNTFSNRHFKNKVLWRRRCKLTPFGR